MSAKDTGGAVRYVVSVRRDCGTDQGDWHERLFSTHAAAKAYAQRKMAEPGWRVSGWPRKVEVEQHADSMPAPSKEPQS
jgi:hypothetical protein